MSTILMALSLGTISMIIVFISGLMSGVVRLGTLTLRSLIAFCLTSAASYFLMMLFDLMMENNKKEQKKVEEELAEDEEGFEEEVFTAEDQPPPQQQQPGFQPLNANDLPNAGR